MPAIYNITVSASDIGNRVMVRRRLTDGREGFGDVIGDLLGWDDDTVTIKTRHETVQVATDTVVAGKLVPPAVPRRHGRDGVGE
ncbi:MAG: hypothetical protein ABI912_05715 [Actinomycetota bacterium]